MFKISAASGPVSPNRMKVIVTFILRGCAFGTLLSFPAKAHAMDELAVVDFEALDKLMAADQVHAPALGLLTAPDPAPTEIINEDGRIGPLQGNPQYPQEEDRQFSSDVPPRAYASFGEDVKAITLP